MVRCLGLLVSGIFLGSCSGSQDCTAIGCIDQASVTIQTANGEWAAGEYVLQVEFDGSASTCRFTLPDDLPPQGQLNPLDCEPKLEAYFWQRVMCTEHRANGSSSQTCTPIPKQFDLQISQQGTPAAVTIGLQLDGATLLQESQTFAYKNAEPNGPGCGPVCRQASVELQIP